MYETPKTPFFYILFDISINYTQAIKNLKTAFFFCKGSIGEKSQLKVEK